jgi:hypothetical protein
MTFKVPETTKCICCKRDAKRGEKYYHTLERLDSFVLAVVGKRLTFKELTA